MLWAYPPSAIVFPAVVIVWVPRPRNWYGPDAVVHVIPDANVRDPYKEYPVVPIVELRVRVNPVQLMFAPMRGMSTE